MNNHPSKKFSLQDQAMFARRLAMLVKAGVPLLESLRLLKTQTRSKRVARAYDAIMRDVAEGQYLSKSLDKQRRLFGDFAINLIKIGETSGTLHENLNYLAEELEKRREMQRKMLSAIAYPAAILIASVGVSALLTVFLFPKLIPVFKSLNVPLPLTTRILLTTSIFLLRDGIWVILAAVLAIPALWFILRKPRVKLYVNRMSIRLPLIGPIIRDYQLSNICRTLGLLLRGYVTLLDAAEVTADTTMNLAYRKELRNLVRAVASGGAISTQLEKHPDLFPPLMTQMVEIGEKTGNLSDTLLYLADFYEKGFDEQNKRLSTVLEPALMLVMGLLVGFVAVSIITPIYAITQYLHA